MQSMQLNPIDFSRLYLIWRTHRQNH